MSLLSKAKCSCVKSPRLSLAAFANKDQRLDLGNVWPGERHPARSSHIMSCGVVFLGKDLVEQPSSPFQQHVSVF